MKEQGFSLAEDSSWNIPGGSGLVGSTVSGRDSVTVKVER